MIEDYIKLNGPSYVRNIADNAKLKVGIRLVALNQSPALAKWKEIVGSSIALVEVIRKFRDKFEISDLPGGGMVKIAGDDTTILDMKRGRLWDIAMRVVGYLKDHGGSARLAAVTFAIGLRRGAIDARIGKQIGKDWGLGRVHPFYKLFEDFFELEDKAGGV